MKEVRVLVVDDEKPARARLVDLLRRSHGVAEVQECADGTSAVRSIVETRPDLVFLDVQMPELDGFGVLREVGAAGAPVVVFVTAYDQFALRAFENCALDYLLKPFSDERFENCLARAVEQVRMRERSDLSARLERLIGSSPAARLAVRESGRVVFLNSDEIVWIEAAGVYVELHTPHRTLLHRATMGDLESQLDPARFARVHRSAIVRLACVRELRPQSHGDSTAILEDGTELRVSRVYRSRLEQCLAQPRQESVS